MKKIVWLVAGTLLLATASCREQESLGHFSQQDEKMTKKEIVSENESGEIDTASFEETQPEYPPKK